MAIESHICQKGGLLIPMRRNMISGEKNGTNDIVTTKPAFGLIKSEHSDHEGCHDEQGIGMIACPTSSVRLTSEPTAAKTVA